MARVLVLAGTTEATELATELEAHGTEVISSFAGVTSTRRSRPGRIRTGGFGGVAGLEQYLTDEGIDALVDATHPFAARMPFNAARAAAAVGVPRCRVLRPPWLPTVGDRWVSVPDLAAAHDAVHSLGARTVFLSTGRQSIGPFASDTDLQLVVRSIEPPEGLPSSAAVVLSRGPFNVDDECQLLQSHAVDVVVTKNSGGDATAAKLVAARQLQLPVVMIERPPQPNGPIVETVDLALSWLTTVICRRA
ncbi:MAG: cobalt-precorrin-6A reductase [Acidimicrobiales bacterium]|nr:cobalt-precorrin-6A reductase [Acidimicrobiales bacterium]